MITQIAQKEQGYIVGVQRLNNFSAESKNLCNLRSEALIEMQIKMITLIAQKELEISSDFNG
jgi:hypothetical protein